MTNKFLSKGTTLQSEPGPLTSVDYVSPDEGIGLPKPKSTKSINDYKTITNKYDLMSGA
jgi:hypothetical protein